jgi:WD40 repeat protein
MSLRKTIDGLLAHTLASYWGPAEATPEIKRFEKDPPGQRLWSDLQRSIVTERLPGMRRIEFEEFEAEVISGPEVIGLIAFACASSRAAPEKRRWIASLHNGPEGAYIALQDGPQAQPFQTISLGPNIWVKANARISMSAKARVIAVASGAHLKTFDIQTGRREQVWTANSPINWFEFDRSQDEELLAIEESGQCTLLSNKSGQHEKIQILKRTARPLCFVNGKLWSTDLTARHLYAGRVDGRDKSASRFDLGVKGAGGRMCASADGRWVTWIDVFSLQFRAMTLDTHEIRVRGQGDPLPGKLVNRSSFGAATSSGDLLLCVHPGNLVRIQLDDGLAEDDRPFDPELSRLLHSSSSLTISGDDSFIIFKCSGRLESVDLKTLTHLPTSMNDRSGSLLDVVGSNGILIRVDEGVSTLYQRKSAKSQVHTTPGADTSQLPMASIAAAASSGGALFIAQRIMRDGQNMCAIYIDAKKIAEIPNFDANCAAAHSSGRFVLGSPQGAVVLIDEASGTWESVFEGCGTTQKLCWDLPGKRIACLTSERAICVFELATREFSRVALVTTKYDWVTSVAFDPLTIEMLTIGYGSGRIAIHNVSTSDCQQLCEGWGTHIASDITYDPAGTYLLVKGKSRVLRILNSKTLKLRGCVNLTSSDDPSVADFDANGNIRILRCQPAKMTMTKELWEVVNG